MWQQEDWIFQRSTLVINSIFILNSLHIYPLYIVIQCQPPKDSETFVHRVGRTGRAGRSGMIIKYKIAKLTFYAGTSITFYSKSQGVRLLALERAVGIQFKRIGAPQTEDIVKTEATKAKGLVSQVHKVYSPILIIIMADIIIGLYSSIHGSCKGTYRTDGSRRSTCSCSGSYCRILKAN
jgi:hypothetical protein